MQVVEEEVDGPPVRAGAERRLDPLEDRAAHLLARNARGGRGRERVGLRGTGPRLLAERVREEGVRSARLRAADAAQDGGAAGLREPSAFDREPRLADSGLAEEDDRARPLLDERLEDEEQRATAADRARLARAEEPTRRAAGAVEDGSRLGGPDVAALDRAAQRARLVGRSESGRAQRELAGVVLTERLGAQSAPREETHEQAPRVLRRGVHLDEPAEERDCELGVSLRAGGARERKDRFHEATAERLAARLEPGGVQVRRGEVAAVERDRLGPAPASSVPRRVLEGIHVHPDVAPQRELAAIEVHPAAAEDLPQVVEGAMQVVRAARRVLLRPERVDRLIAREGTSRRERHELQEIGGAPPPPRVCGDRRVRADHLEPAEQVEPQRGLRALALAGGGISRLAFHRRSRGERLPEVRGVGPSPG